jgi:cation diffusion facilitator CzcD-associated flavoprotein CzcO
MAQKRILKVAIIGAGMSGLCMAVKLQDAGIDTYTIFESADEVGGTWRDNTYPGLSCDVPSRFYTYSFRQNPWLVAADVSRAGDPFVLQADRSRCQAFRTCSC